VLFCDTSKAICIFVPWQTNEARKIAKRQKGNW
jgi:hypothetical protein